MRGNIPPFKSYQREFLRSCSTEKFCNSPEEVLQENNRIYKIFCKEIMKVRRLEANNLFKRKQVEQENEGLL
jgi:hypothetical protein